MKIRQVRHNNRKRSFEARSARRCWSLPYAKVDPRPTSEDPVRRVYVDPELAHEGFTFVLESGREGTVHMEQVLEYNQDPDYLRQNLLYNLTIEAQKHVDRSGLAKREIIRRLGTSATQFYRLLDQTNDRKSVDGLLKLLHVLECDVDIVVARR